EEGQDNHHTSARQELGSPVHSRTSLDREQTLACSTPKNRTSRDEGTAVTHAGMNENEDSASRLIYRAEEWPAMDRPRPRSSALGGALPGSTCGMEESAVKREELFKPGRRRIGEELGPESPGATSEDDLRLRELPEADRA